MPNNKSNKGNTSSSNNSSRQRRLRKKKKYEKKSKQAQVEDKVNEEDDSPVHKKRNMKSSPKSQSDEIGGKEESPNSNNKKSPSTVEKLEQVNKDMIDEVEHFNNEFVKKNTSDESPNIDKTCNTPQGDKPLKNIITPRHSQPNLQQFGFQTSKKDNSKDALEEIRKAQEEFVKRKGAENFVSGIAINLLKVEKGTFDKIDTGEDMEVEATPIEIPDKNPNFVGQKLDGKEEKKNEKEPEKNNEMPSDSIESNDPSPPEEPGKQTDKQSENEQSINLDEQESYEFQVCDENDELIRNFPDSEPETPPKKPKEQKKKKKKAKHPKGNTATVNLAPSNFFTPIVHEKPPPSNENNNEEDDIDTIASGETSIISSKEQANKQVPPKYIRYRFVIELNHLDLQNEESKNEQTPEEKYRQIFWDLSKYIKNIDSDAKFISWKNSPTFTFLPVNVEEFPTELEKIAVFFNGFRAKLKMDYRHTFRICIHSPKWNATWMEMKLTAWAQARSYYISKCNIQSEESTVIGWLVYSFPFSNITALKSYLMDRSDHEWGFKLGSPTTSDKNLPWRDRMKALEVMVPSDNEESARQLISESFSPYKKQGKHKTFTDYYLFVGREKEHKSDELAMIYSEMLGRHKFRLTTIEITQVTSIIKDIDRKVVTKDNSIMTIREMILNLTSKEQKLVPCSIFLSVDFVAKADDMWFRNTKGKGGACYYLSHYSWDSGEATTIAKGLGRYLAHYYGMEAVEEFFSADHWKVTQQWKWNK